MFKRLYRELYLLPRGEQRALILVSLLLIFSLFFRVTVQLIPDRKPDGLEEFEQEARMIIASLASADTIQRVRGETMKSKGGGYPVRANRSRTPQQRRNPAQPIDINRADSLHLLPLPGIGPVYAGRIIKYRNLLGGFVSVEQLEEVYGIPGETVELIKDHIHFDTSVIRKIPLNDATFKELLKHPYLEYEDVKAIVNYREFEGTIQSFQELRDNFILQDSLMDRVLPYLGL